VKITGRGIGVLVAGVLLLVVGGWLDYPEVAAIGAAGVLAVLVAVGAGLVRPQLTVIRAVHPDRVMRGEPCQVTLDIHNAKRWGALTLVGDDRCGTRTVQVPLVRLPAGRATTVRYPVPTRRRGLIPLGPLRVGRRDPFGLARVQRTFGDQALVWVYPYVHPIAGVPDGSARNLDGLAERVPHGSITFDALREYVPGDDLRQVHWRTTARIGELMVRERVDTSRPRIVVLLDDRARVHAGDTFEHACEAAASVISAVSREGLSVHLLTASGASVPVLPGTSGYLDTLAEATLRADRDLAGSGLHGIAERARHLQAGDTLVCLTGRVTPEDLGTMMALRGTYPAILVGAFGPALPNPRTGRNIMVLAARDGADFARLWDGVWA
jgi:uncharacterized protein (DUF58 family)